MHDMCVCGMCMCECVSLCVYACECLYLVVYVCVHMPGVYVSMPVRICICVCTVSVCVYVVCLWALVCVWCMSV